MPDYRRAHVRAGTYFFTVNTYRRQTFLIDAGVRLGPAGSDRNASFTHRYDRGLGVAA